MSRSPRLKIICIIVCGFFWSQFSYASISEEETIPESFELEVKVRMKNMSCIVTPRLNEEVKFYLGKYIFKHPSFTAKMLGNAALYFPIFENLLQKKGMPSELKALSILESWLDPAATSRVGAGGLWQLMPQTARMYGLEVGKQVDERRDLYKSTEAALTLLKNLYDIYGDWGLSLAAYNVGPVRVNNAIKKCGVEKPSFWSIAPFLPKETQHFVPKFIAFTYLINYYAEHEIYPEFPDLDLQFVDVIKVYKKLNIEEISAISGVGTDILKKLNPGYRNGVIPHSTKGYNLVLPKRIIDQVLVYLDITDKQLKQQFLGEINIENELLELEGAAEHVLYVESIYIVDEGDDLDFVAYKFDIKKLRIMLWNHLSSEHLITGQQLKLFIPLKTYKERMVVELHPLECLGVMTPDDLFKSEAKGLSDERLEETNKALSCSFNIIYHTIRTGETWLDIALQYPYSNLSDIQKINSNVNLVSGRQLAIPIVDAHDGTITSKSLYSKR